MSVNTDSLSYSEEEEGATSTSSYKGGDGESFSRDERKNQGFANKKLRREKESTLSCVKRRGQEVSLHYQLCSLAHFSQPL